jgi:hypothetical protein
MALINVNFSVMLPIDNNLSIAKEPFKTLDFLAGYCHSHSRW